jgi:hypothetical protein
MKDIGNADKQETGCWMNNRGEIAPAIPLFDPVRRGLEAVFTLACCPD